MVKLYIMIISFVSMKIFMPIQAAEQAVIHRLSTSSYKHKRPSSSSKQKVTRLEKKFLDLLKASESARKIDEESVEERLNWYYKKKVALDLMLDGHITDVDGSYQLITDIGLATVFSIYCTKPKAFDAQYIKEIFQKLGFNLFTCHKLYVILEIWRKNLPRDITIEEMVDKEVSRELPESLVSSTDNLPHKDSFVRNVSISKAVEVHNSSVVLYQYRSIHESSGRILSGYKLSYFPIRARAEAIRLILAYGAIDYEDVVISFNEWDNCKYDRSINHFEQLPSLILPNGNLISQSGSIVRYLAKIVGVYPSDCQLAAEADMVFELSKDMNDINPILNWFEKDSNDFHTKYASYFAAFPGRMQAALDILKDKKFFGGDSPHFGDFGLFHVVDLSITVQPSCLDDFPIIKSWYDRVLKIPRVSKYLQERPKAGTGSVGKAGSLIHSE